MGECQRINTRKTFVKIVELSRRLCINHMITESRPAEI